MGGNKPTATVWRAATQEVTAPLVDGVESDGLGAIRKTLEQYRTKAEYLGNLCLATKNGKLVSVIAFYQRAVRNLENLLPEYSFDPAL